jgi:hypothetical protein
MPSGWEQRTRELGALEQLWEIRNVKDLLPVNFPCLTSTPSFSETAVLLQLEGTIHADQNAVYERIASSGLEVSLVLVICCYRELWTWERRWGIFLCCLRSDQIPNGRENGHPAFPEFCLTVRI